LAPEVFCQAVTAAYGASLVLFVIELRHLGTARTGAYYSIGPFFGAVLSIALLLTEFREAARLSPGTPLMTAWLAAAYARSGNRPEALKLLASLSVQAQHEYVSPYYRAIRGKRDGLFVLERGYRVQSSGSPSRQIARPQCDRRQNHSCYCQGRWVTRLQPEQQRARRACGSEG
jgi:hypothetical protein